MEFIGIPVVPEIVSGKQVPCGRPIPCSAMGAPGPSDRTARAAGERVPALVQRTEPTR